MLYNIQVVSYSFILPMEKEVLLKKLGERIRKIRKEKGITQKNLAHSLNRDQQAIQRLEAGNTNPTFTFLHEVAIGLDTPITDLLLLQ
jgi:putative transcriptional regulator